VATYVVGLLTVTVSAEISGDAAELTVTGEGLVVYMLLQQRRKLTIMTVKSHCQNDSCKQSMRNLVRDPDERYKLELSQSIDFPSVRTELRCC
jgi:hypothetical protein